MSTGAYIESGNKAAIAGIKAKHPTRFELFSGEKDRHVIAAWVSRDDNNNIIYSDPRRPPVDLTAVLEGTHTTLKR